ncbi:hypothetical protein B484DRAFT_448679 [Ochromonadaceae sp. CCMP2298]|nr:hypothetical protein B484DRAFT_448679 [Ochromonadaceae sp. CCMP2298]
MPTEVPLGDPFVPPSDDLAGTPRHELASQFANTAPPADDLHYLCERKDSGDGRDADNDDRDDVIMLSDGSVLKESDRKRGGDEADASNPFVGGSILRGLISQPIHTHTAAMGMSSVPPQSGLGPSRSQLKAAAKLGKPLAKKELNKINKQQIAPNPNQCSRVFILKVLSSLAEHLKTRSIKDIHCIGREARLVEVWFQAARRACCLPSYKGEQELYGGLQFVDNSHSYWWEPLELVDWWEKNVMDERAFDAMQRDSNGGKINAIRRARWGQAVAEHCTTIRSAMTPPPANAPFGPLPTARAAPNTTTATGHIAATPRSASASGSGSASTPQGVQPTDVPAVKGMGLLKQSDLPPPSQAKVTKLGKRKHTDVSEGCVMSAPSTAEIEASNPQGRISQPVKVPPAAMGITSVPAQSGLGPSSQRKVPAKLGKPLPKKPLPKKQVRKIVQDQTEHRVDDDEDNEEMLRLITTSQPFVSPGDPADVAEVHKVLPLHIREYLQNRDLNLVEVVMDLGQNPYFYYCPASQGFFEMLREDMEVLVSAADLALVTAAVGSFSEADNRAGIDKTLHRVSRRLNRSGVVIGLTLRLGRSVPGMYLLLQRELEQGKSVLLVGCPGAGKTTLLRDCACFLALTRRVEIVDTSNEIAGNGDISHPAIGRARRIMVPERKQQHMTMLEAVQNHTPQAMVIDEIGSAQEVIAARDIKGRGVQLLATVHGTTLSDVCNSLILGKLLGDTHTVVLSAGEVVQRGEARKSVRERKEPCCFDVIVEIHKTGCCVVISDANSCVDRLLNNSPYEAELRVLESATHVSKKTLRVRGSKPI